MTTNPPADAAKLTNGGQYDQDYTPGAERAREIVSWVYGARNRDIVYRKVRDALNDAADLLAAQASQIETIDAALQRFHDRATAAEAQIEALTKERDAAVSITVGGGLSVHGSFEAIRRVQDYILLDSTHPIETHDTRRSLARSLQAAEAKAAKMREALEEWLGWLDFSGEFDGNEAGYEQAILTKMRAALDQEARP